MLEVSTTPCALLILAGGASSRMGTPKALLMSPPGHPHGPAAALSLLELWFRLGEGIGLNPIRTVLGVHAHAVLEALPHRTQQTLLNPQPEKGQSSSLSIGLRAIQGANVPCLVTPVDCPPLPVDTFCGVIGRLLEHAQALQGAFTAILPTCHGRPGHPVLLSQATVSRLAQCTPLPPLDTILAQSESVHRLELNAPEILVNLNTPSDWQGWRDARVTPAR